MKDFLSVLDHDSTLLVINRAYIVLVHPRDFESFRESGCQIVIQSGSLTRDVYVDPGAQTDAVLAFIGYEP